VKLVLLLSKRSDMEALRFIAKKGSETAKPLVEKLAALEFEDRWPILPQIKVDELADNLWNDQRALDYLRKERGFEDDTLRAFEVGYDPEKDMVVVPIHDRNGNPIGVNGRSVVGKQFKLSRRIPRNKVLFNMHRAKQAGGTAIVCESQFDVMRIHQAGFPNAVCALGSYISKEQAALLQRYFDRVIIMMDADKPGRKAGHTLSAMLRSMRVEWAIHDWGVIYPHGAKDAGDMTDEEIRYVINNAVSDVAYKSYKSLA
jgi:5S rRNA maturation endonuclease (ribonuclease M5)